MNSSFNLLLRVLVQKQIANLNALTSKIIVMFGQYNINHSIFIELQEITISTKGH